MGRRQRRRGGQRRRKRARLPRARPSSSRPRVAAGYGEPFWPFLAAGAITSGVGLVVQRLTSGGRSIAPRDAFLAVALVWVAVPVVRRASVRARRRLRALAPRSTPTSRRCPASRRRARPSSRRSRASTGRCSSGASSPNGWAGWGSSSSPSQCSRSSASAAGSSSSPSWPGPTELERLTATIRETARRLWVLYVALTGACILALARPRLDRRRRGDDAVRGRLARVHRRLDRRVLDAEPLARRRSGRRPSGSCSRSSSSPA